MNLKHLIYFLLPLFFIGCTEQDELLLKDIGILRYEIDGKPYQTAIKYKVDTGYSYPFFNNDIGRSSSGTGSSVIFTDHTDGDRGLLQLSRHCYIEPLTNKTVCKDSAWSDNQTELLKVGIKIPFDTPHGASNTKPDLYASLRFMIDGSMYSVPDKLNNEVPGSLTILKNDEEVFEATFECVIAYLSDKNKKSILKNGFISVRRN